MARACTDPFYSAPITPEPFHQLIINPDGSYADGDIIPLADLLPPQCSHPLLELDVHFTPTEHDKARKDGPYGRGTGPDKTPHELLKHALGPLFTAKQLEYFNYLLDSGAYDDELCEGILIFLYKRDKPQYTKNYGGLTLTNHIAKEVERMIFRRLRLCAQTGCIRQDEFAFARAIAL